MIVDYLKAHVDSYPRLKRGLRAVRNRGLWLKFLVGRNLSDDEFFRFRCNICGHESVSPLAVVKGREDPSCYSCGSHRRYRTIAAVLSQEFFGEIVPVPDFRPSRDIVGIGLSDSDIYARPLSKVFSYVNTYYHKEPRLDIMSVDEEMCERADFVISSDVFEHVPPPVDGAFENLFEILKPGGVCLFSVPFKNEGVTEEHFPDLFEYEIVTRNGDRVLVNRTRQGDEQVFENLRFHGGPGATLEMRKFSRQSLLDHIEEAGFVDIKFHGTSIPEYGVLVDEDATSLIMSMRKPM